MGVCFGRNVFGRLGGEEGHVGGEGCWWDRLGSGTKGMSCHTSCNPPSPALKTFALSLNLRSPSSWQPHTRASKATNQTLPSVPLAICHGLAGFI